MVFECKIELLTDSHFAPPDTRRFVFIGTGLIDCGSELMEEEGVKRMIARCGHAQYMINEICYTHSI